MIIETVPMNVLRKNGAKNITLKLLDDVSRTYNIVDNPEKFILKLELISYN